MTREEVKDLVLEYFPLFEDKYELFWEYIGNNSEILTDEDFCEDYGVTVTDTEILFHEAEPNYIKFSFDDENRLDIIDALEHFYDDYPLDDFKLEVSVSSSDKERIKALANIIKYTCKELGLNLYNCRRVPAVINIDNDFPDNESYI